MAVTFRDFFRGLAEGAPAMADMVYKSTLYANQQQFQQEQLELEKQRTESTVRYQDAQVGLIEQQTAEMKSASVVALDIQKLELAKRKIGAALEQGKYEALLNYKGPGGNGIDGWYTDTYLKDREKLQAEIDNLKGSTTSLAARDQIAEAQAKLESLDVLMNTGMTLLNLTVSPEDQAKMTAIIPNHVAEDGTLDFLGMLAEAKDQEIFMQSPQKQSIFASLLVNEHNWQRNYKLNVLGQATSIVGARTQGMSQEDVYKLNKKRDFNKEIVDTATQLYNMPQMQDLGMRASLIDNIYGEQLEWNFPRPGIKEPPPTETEETGGTFSDAGWTGSPENARVQEEASRAQDRINNRTPGYLRAFNIYK